MNTNHTISETPLPTHPLIHFLATIFFTFITEIFHNVEIKISPYFSIWVFKRTFATSCFLKRKLELTLLSQLLYSKYCHVTKAYVLICLWNSTLMVAPLFVTLGYTVQSTNEIYEVSPKSILCVYSMGEMIVQFLLTTVYSI